MTRKLRKNAAQDALLDEALKFLMEAPDDELNHLIAEGGEQPADLDRRSKAAFDAAFKQYGQHKREALKRGATPVVARIEAIAAKLPTARDELLAMAHRLVVQSLTAGRSVSMQHRDLSELTDDDLRQAVAEMQALAEAAGDKGNG